MEQATASDLERRKKVRVRLRGDLEINVQKYEGRRYYVVKDPVCLRYYRFKEQERFLLDLMDGKHTLDEAQKRFEERFRPERLPLEDLEAFASQLLEAGLAMNETPDSGKKLYDRYKKRKRKTLMQAFLNILYIKIPLFDPDRLLTAMLPPLRFIFTRWFLVLSVLFFLTALGLVLSQWNTFLAKLPTYHEFFTMQTLVYMWVALGLVKVIHEFGHGLSCKAFGGEVHEMGALLLCLSPCLYCNVSDSWMLPDKWKRIIIGAAGIYVELIIASFATFVWWITDGGTFINNFCISLMLVCSVSTVIFNANPLMRFDGYYILSDWLEIPNLRERSNRYLASLFKQHCLGIEVPPEPYMTRRRQFLFVFYAIVSYIYRWVVTFSILYFLYTFLKPYKLGSISYLLGTGAVGSMVGMPLYQLGKGIHRRGRLPDMKPVRVWITVGVVVAALVVVMLIPFPVKVRGLALVQVKPDEKSSMKVVAPDPGGLLREVSVEDGQWVRAGDPLAVLHNPELEIELQKLEKGIDALQRQINELSGYPGRSTQAEGDLQKATNERDTARRELFKRKAQWDKLRIKAPRDGVVMLPPTVGVRLHKEDQGKQVEKGTLLCVVGDPKALRAITLVEPSDLELLHLGDRAWIRLHGRGYNYWRGTVSGISSVEAREIPPQLSARAGGDVPTQPDPRTQAEVAQTQHYLIAVDFDEIDDAFHPGSLGRVKIECTSHTLWWRLHRYLRTTFNWGL